MIVKLVESGLEVQKRKGAEFSALAAKFRGAKDEKEAALPGDELGRMVFGDWCRGLGSWLPSSD